MMESTPSRANRDTILDVNLFSENLAEVSNWKTKVFAFLFFISIALLALKLHLRRIITKNYTTTSIRMLLFGLVSTNVHLPSHTHLGPDYMANFSPVTRAEILARLLKQIHLKSNWRYMEKDSDEQTSNRNKISATLEIEIRHVIRPLVYFHCLMGYVLFFCLISSGKQ